MAKGVRAGVATGLEPRQPPSLGRDPWSRISRGRTSIGFRGLGRVRRWAKLFDRAKRRNLTWQGA